MTGSRWQWERAFGSVSRVRPRLADFWADAPADVDEPTEMPVNRMVERNPNPETVLEARDIVREEFHSHHEVRDRIESETRTETESETVRTVDRQTRFERAMAEVRRMEREIRATHELRDREVSRTERHSEIETDTRETLTERVANPIERLLERQIRESQTHRRSDRFETRIREIVRQEIAQRSEPDVRVEIGRIDVVPAASTPTAGKSKSERPRPILDLETYLRQREERR